MNRTRWLLVLGCLLVVGLACALALAGGGLAAWMYASLDRSVAERDVPSRASTDPREGAQPVPTGGDLPSGGDLPGDAARPSGAAGTPRSGGSLVLPGGEPSTLDPALVRDVATAAYLYEIYSGLVTLSPELAVVPDMAERWEVSPDGTVYTFTLRADTVFHDGSPAGAGDVVYAIERACDPATGSDVAETYLGDIVGCSDKLAGRADRVVGLAAPDDRTVVITIDAPKAYFLSKLTYPTAFVVDRRQIEGDPDWTAHPNGTGPFRLAEHSPDASLVLDRHADYYGRKAYLDSVTYDLRPVSAMTLYENGELDATPVGLGDLDRARDPLNPLSSEIAEGSGELGISYLGFDTRQPPFDDPHVRRAFNFALDRERLAEVVLGGGVRPAGTILPPGMPGYRAANSPYTFDPERARAELAQSRYGGPDGLPPITLFTSGEGGDPVAEAVADLLGEALEVEVRVEQAPWETFQDEVDAGRYPLFMLGWSADYADPQDFLDVLFHSRSPLNHSGYANPVLDALLEAARVEQDQARRLDLYAQAERMILEDGVWVPLYTGVDTWLVAPYVHGFSLPSIVVPRMGAVWVDQN